MKQWLYKTTDTEIDRGRRRPSFEKTSALALEDKILCRGAFNRGTRQRSALVWRVASGDLLHVFHRNSAEEKGVHFIGTFRVGDPGSARFHPECALARVDDPKLSARLRDAYDIPATDPIVTGWILEPAGDVAPKGREQLEYFLSGRNTLVEYHPPRDAESAVEANGDSGPAVSGAPRPARTREEVARELIAWHFRITPETSEIYHLHDAEEDRADEPIKLLEVNSESCETGSIDTFGFDAAGDITYPTAVAEITPHELELIHLGQLDLPPGWDLGTATRFSREEFPAAPLEGTAA